MTHQVIHLDSHILKKPMSGDTFGILDAPHRKGIELYPAVDEALKVIEQCLGAGGYHFQVTPGGFFAMQHLLMHFYLEEVRQSGKNHFLSSCTEEAPILKALDRLEMMGCGVKLLPVDSNGRIDLKALKESIRTKTSLLSFSAVCALTGVMQPVQEIIEICHANGVKVHVNVSHAIGTILGAGGVSLKEWNADYITLDGDKIGTSQGLGALFSKESIKESMPGVIPIAAALKQVTERQEAFAMEIARLRSEFEDELVRAFPECTIFGREVERAPHIFAVSFPGLMNEALLYALYRHNIDASIGGGQFQTLTTILKKCGFSDETALGAISFALHDGILEDDLAKALDVIIMSVRKLKKMSVML